MAIRSALQSALAGMTAAHDRLASAAQILAKPIVESRSRSSAAIAAEDDPAEARPSASDSVSGDLGRSLISLHESLSQARMSSATAGAAQDMLDQLLEISRR